MAKILFQRLWRLCPVAILLLAGCGSGNPPFFPENGTDTDADSDSDSDSDTDADTDSDTDSDSDTDTDSDTDSDTETNTYDCESLTLGPLDVTYIDGPVASEDIGFDEDGNLVGSNNYAIFKTQMDSDPVLFVAGLDFRAGMRYLPDGHLMVNHNSDGTLRRINPEGEQTIVLTGLSYPNGMTVDPLGYVYVTEHDAGRVLRVDPYANTSETLVTNLTNANGITFNNDYDMLYIGSWYGDDNVLYTMDIDIESGDHGELTPWVTNVGSGWHDGLGVDICGNVYVCDWDCEGWGGTCIYRISPDGVVEDEPIVLPSTDMYIPNFDWGSGIGGWDPETLYIPHGWNHSVWEVWIGIPSKPPVYP